MPWDMSDLMPTIDEDAKAFADHATEVLRGHLHRLGIRSRIADRRVTLEKLGSRLFGVEEQGFIEIVDDPIRWVKPWM